MYEIISLQGARKNVQECEGKNVFYAAVDDPLDSTTKIVREGSLQGEPKDALSDLHKDAQEGAFEVAHKCAFEVTLELHLWLHLLMQSLMDKCIQNGSSNIGPDVALVGALAGGLNVVLKWVPQSLV